MFSYKSSVKKKNQFNDWSAREPSACKEREARVKAFCTNTILNLYKPFKRAAASRHASRRRIRSGRFLFSFIVILLCFVSSFAQSNIPTPRSVLGFNPGDDRTVADWKQITDYFAVLDKASDRIELKTIGTTTLNRPMLVAFISAKENIRDLEKYKAIQHKLADPRNIANMEERDKLLSKGKTIVAISCSIHSTEIVASQMSMQLAYNMAVATDEETKEILRNTILMLIPSSNPDGIDIVANWYKKTLDTPHEGTNPPELYHHYAGHDNNRDWFMLNLKETRLITQLFWKEWFPEIVYDVHQMGATGPRFSIPPFYDPSNPNIPPTILREVGLIGYAMAADLQAQNYKGVITNAIYDTWWHGGFRSTPYYHNSIGILSEAASARLMTPIRIKEEDLEKQRPQRGVPPSLGTSTNYPDPWRGGFWGAREIMQMEMIACRTVLTLASHYRAKYLKNFYELNRISASERSNPAHPYAYLIPPGQGNEESVSRMIEILMAQGVEVHKLNRELHLSFVGQETNNAETPAGSYLILMAQPTRNNIQALFEKQVYPDRVGPSGLAEQPYDVAGWTLPMMMGVQTHAVSRIAETDFTKHLKLISDINEVRKDLALDEKQGDMPPIKNPIKGNVRVGLYKSWMASMDEGWTRFVFDTFNVPYKSILDRDVRRRNLRESFDVIVLPSQNDKQIVEGNPKGSYPEEYTGGITETGVENLRLFVESGGTLISFDDSTEFAIKSFKLPVKNVLEGLRSSDFYCPGSVLSIDVDNKHPLAGWMKPKTDAYFTNSAAFEVLDNSANVTVIARYAEKDVLRSGWLRGEKFMAGKVALAEINVGKGRVILFGFRPQHRGQTWGTFQFIFNAIMRGAV